MIDAPTGVFTRGPGLAAWRRAGYALVFAAFGVAAFLAATHVQAPSLGLAVGVAAGVGIGVWMFFSERIERPLAVFLLYLGLLDGFLKLRTNSSSITLGRDALLYAIVLGYLARATLRRQSLPLPPLSGWVLAFAAVVLVQLFNPADTGVTHIPGALRPHLEFVPLFFIGHAVLQTKARLRLFFALMLVIAFANGIVNVVQLDMSPAQLASWGPGYAARINGVGVSGRVYTTSAGTVRTRPFGLGDDSGVGELWGMLAFGGALALVTLATRQSIGRFALLLCVGPPLAIISGESRGALLASVAALVAYTWFATSARRLIPTLAGLILAIVVIGGVFAYISSVSGAGVFARYATITPAQLASTTGKARGPSFAAIPQLITHHPLGFGLGSVGPAASFAGGGNVGGNGETEPGFLVSELGIPGLLVVYGFNLRLLFLGVTRARRLEPETRTYVAALLAGLVGLLLLGVSSATTATSPASAYLWFAGGALSYWLTVARGKGRAVTGENGQQAGHAKVLAAV